MSKAQQNDDMTVTLCDGFDVSIMQLPVKTAVKNIEDLTLSELEQ